MLVWHLDRQEFVSLRSWMRWCPDIYTNALKFSDEDWDTLIQSERK